MKRAFWVWTTHKSRRQHAQTVGIHAVQTLCINLTWRPPYVDFKRAAVHHRARTVSRPCNVHSTESTNELHCTTDGGRAAHLLYYNVTTVMVGNITAEHVATSLNRYFFDFGVGTIHLVLYFLSIFGGGEGDA